jgi:hypothetical protein
MKILVLFVFVLTNAAIAAAATRTWDGGGADANWNTPANWVGDVAPSANDDLVFPAEAKQFVTNNNFFLLTNFNSITFEGGNYTIGGNLFRLSNGMTANAGTQTINTAITLNGSQTILAGQSAFITLLGLSIGSSQLTLDGEGIIGIGLISGSGPVIKTGLGVTAIVAASGFSSPLTLNNGIMIVDANIPNSTVTVNTVSPGGSFALSGFGGTGTVGTTNVIQGIISAGTLTSPTGILNITNGLSFTENGAFVCKIGGTTPGSGGHDQLNVTGSVNLANAILAPIPWDNFVPAVGDEFVVIRNDGSDPIQGTFLNAPEGSVFAGPFNTAFRITYLGGDGNDVMIKRVPRAAFDFDGDGRTDIGTYTGTAWLFNESSSGTTQAVNFGLQDDLIAPADFDGDNRADIAVFRPSNGVWYILNSATSTVTFTQFGLAGDLPVPNDFDGDGRADIAVFRPSDGIWYQLRSLGNQFAAFKFGLAGDIPLIADYDGDGIGDPTIFRPADGAWYFLLSSEPTFVAFPFGLNGDIPVPADYDGDGKTDAAVFRATADGSQPDFYILRSSDLSVQYSSFGIPGDIPVVGDYDGDGFADLGVVRPGAPGDPSIWYLLRTTAGFDALPFTPGLRPIPSAYNVR